MYKALRFGAEAPYALLKWELIESTGWSLGYVDTLDRGIILEWLAVRRGRALAEPKPKKTPARGRRR